VNQNGEEDRTIQGIGIEVHGGRAVVLIASGSRTPVARAMTFTTVADGQSAVEVRIVRCSLPGAGSAPARDPQTSRPQGVVGRFLVPGLRRSRCGEARIDIGVSLDREGVIRAWGRDRHTGARQEATLPGLWALPARVRPGAVSRLARRLESDLELQWAHGLQSEGRLLRWHAEEAAGGPFLAALAGELDVLRRSAVEPPLPVT
jgi:molecular chaperone DnaK (HSP70)